MDDRHPTAPGWITEAGLRWRRLTPFGAEIDHDLASPLSAAQADQLYSLLDQEGLILARGQTLSMDQQKALLAPLGPDLHREYAGDTGYITTEGDGVQASRAELSFHSDNAYTDQPLAAISLHALDVVDDASSTRFVNAARAYDSLAPALRQELDGWSAQMIKPGRNHIGGRSCDLREPEAQVSATFPAVRVNPRTGQRYIGLSEMQTARLLDMDWARSQARLHAIYDHLYAPENSFEHRWRGGDILIWDNLTLQHARGSLAEAGRRVLQRVVACN